MPAGIICPRKPQKTSCTKSQRESGAEQSSDKLTASHTTLHALANLLEEKYNEDSNSVLGLHLKQAAVSSSWARKHMYMCVCYTYAHTSVYIWTDTDSLVPVYESLVCFCGEKYFKSFFLRRILRGASRILLKKVPSLLSWSIPPLPNLSSVSFQKKEAPLNPSRLGWGGGGRSTPLPSRLCLPRQGRCPPHQGDCTTLLGPRSAGASRHSASAAIAHAELNASHLSAP